jgi:hypothetical protein
MRCCFALAPERVSDLIWIYTALDEKFNAIFAITFCRLRGNVRVDSNPMLD